MLGEPLVHERVVGGQEIQRAVILAHDAVEEQLGFVAQALAQRVVEIGEQHFRWGHGREVPQLQPLTGEIRRERFRSRIGEHPPDLALEHGRVFQPSVGRGVQQFVIGHAAPQEKREARRQVHVADLIVVRGRFCRLRLDAEQELGADEELLEPALDALLEARVLPAFGVRREHYFQIIVHDRPPVRASCKGRENGFGTGAVGRGVRGSARKNPAAARGLADARVAERSGDRHNAQRGTGRTAHRWIHEGPSVRFGKQGRRFDEGRADLVRPGLHRQADFEALVRFVAVGVHRARPALDAE